jgi:phosphate transport system substrate-binding protein
MIHSVTRRVLRTFGATGLVLAVAATGWSCKSEGESEAKNSSGGGGGDAAQVQLVGAGASFPAPLYTQWFKDYNQKHPNTVVEYQSIGSGGGIKQFTAGTVDFGASDAAMKPEEISKVKGGVVLLPMTAGAVVLTYNIPGVTDLQLSRKAYTDIFLGKITKWNDPALKELNPKANLPDSTINVVRRADGSGTTYAFTNHLSTISPDWKAGPGTGTSVNWPVGTGGKGNEGITALVKQTPGSIGYVEYGYAKSNNQPMAILENKSGKMVAPTPDSAAKALGAVEMPESLIAWLPDPEGAESYPIVTYTWLLAKPVYEDADKGKALKQVIEYGLTEGQKIADQLGYVPLPEKVVAKVKAKAETIKAGS